MITANALVPDGCQVMCDHNLDIDGLVQDCSTSSALAMELLQSCAKPSIWFWMMFKVLLTINKIPQAYKFTKFKKNKKNLGFYAF